MKAGFGDVDLAFDDVAFPAQYPAAGAPGQEFRIGFDIVDQIEHLLRGEFYQRAFLYHRNHLQHPEYVQEYQKDRGRRDVFDQNLPDLKTLRRHFQFLLGIGLAHGPAGE